MGLDTSHNCWHGSYGGFNEFRYRLGYQIGINLDEYNGYGDNGTKNLSEIDHDIEPLLNHSDCDGELTVEQAQRVALGLHNILDKQKSSLVDDPWLISHITQFRDGCQLAVSQNEAVEFH